MATATVERPDIEQLKAVAKEAIEDGVHAANRAVKSVRRRVEELGDFKDVAAYRVKRQPLAAVGAAFGIGLALGLAVALIAIARRPGEGE